MNLSNENIIHIKGKNSEYLQFKKLLEYDDIVHAFSIGKEVDYRTSSVERYECSQKDTYNNAINNYNNLCSDLGIDYNNIIKPEQKHTDNIKIVQKKVNKCEPDIYIKDYTNTDGLISQKSNMILATTSADCILMLFFDPITKTIANIHSGWKGTYQQIALKTVKKMKSQFGVKTENLICCMCPSICKCHFEVRKEVKDMFESKFKDIQEKIHFIKEAENAKEEKWYIDTISLNKQILYQQGLTKENVIDSNICTVCESNVLHSYRIEKEQYGLETAIITLL